MKFRSKGFGFKPQPLTPEHAARVAVHRHIRFLHDASGLQLLLLSLTKNEQKIIGHLHGNDNAVFADFAEDPETLRRAIDRLNEKLLGQTTVPLEVKKCGGRLWLDVR